MRDIRPTAGVGDFFAHYAARGCRVERPLRGDVVCYDWSGRGRFDSHIGFVDRVLSIKLGSRWLMRTCEGNTSASDSGSQDNGDGVYLKKRWVLMHSNDAAFIRLKGGAVIPPSHV